MTGSIRASVTVGHPGQCPVAEASAATQSRVENVSRASGTTPEGQVAEEFVLEHDASLPPSIADETFETASGTIYRFFRTPGEDCVCEVIEAAGCPVSAVSATDGELSVSFHAPTLTELGEIVQTLTDTFEHVHVRSLSRTTDDNRQELMLVDRGVLTDRQREVLETSLAMGYFEHPKGANAGEVADALGISSSTYREHLAAAQRKIMEAVLDAA